MPRSKKTTAKAETSVEKEIVAETVVEAAPAEEKKPAAKKTAAKKPAAKKAAVESKVVIQANGSEATAEDLVNKSIAAAGVKTVKKVDVYVRPEINKVYYVINGDVLGEFDLF
ncbi:MAG: hypothetical protein IKK47_01080 [Ruminococcus sp.]|nr:hypothetical protein [Ruminococcus sp.]